MFMRKRGSVAAPAKAEASLISGLAEAPRAAAAVYSVATGDVGLDALKREVHARLLEEADAGMFKQDLATPEAEKLLRRLLVEISMKRGDLVGQARLEQLLAEMMNEIRGLGPLEPLMNDPSISEIMVNSPEQVYVEQNGVIKLTGVRFDGDRHLLRIIDRIVSRVGRHIDEGNPMCDARLPDGSRVNAIIPPLALNGPCLTIRRFSRRPLTVTDLIEKGAMTEGLALFLRRCVEARLNILVSGGTGSGKTTILNVLSAFIPSGERLVTIEDAAELQIQQPHVIRLETRQPNTEGQGEVGQAELLRNCLRMRPDRIIIGEVRGGEALSMLQAMNTGHEGSLTTVHANTCRDSLSRLETMVLMAGLDLPHRVIREQIASAIDLVVQIERLADGRRVVSQVAELVDLEGDIYVLQDLFTFKSAGRAEDGTVLGRIAPMGIVPRCLTKLESKGYGLPLAAFQGG